MKYGCTADTSERHFPVLLSHRPRRQVYACPRSVPWALLAPHEEQARANHDQSLEQLAKRGGLDPIEMVAVLEDRKWMSMEFPEAVDRLNALLLAHEKQDDIDEMVRQFKESAGPGEPFWFILARDARAALARGDVALAEKLVAKTEKMKEVEDRISKRSG